MNEYHKRAHELLLKVSPTHQHLSAIRYYAQAAVWGLLALVEELRLWREFYKEWGTRT
jgi:hypothetical protein